jgi:hypothetical protein
MHTTKKSKKERSKKQRPIAMVKLITASLEPPRRKYPNYKRDSPKAMPQRRKQYTSVVVVQSKILDFHPRESLISQNNAFSKDTTRYIQPTKVKP